MHLTRPFLALLFCLIAFPSLAQDLPDSVTITRQAPDDVALVADFYAAPEETTEAPVIIALHMLNSKRSAYAPIIPDLHAAGYAILNVDMRGHGESGGSRDWDAAIADIADWIDWLDTEGQLYEKAWRSWARASAPMSPSSVVLKVRFARARLRFRPGWITAASNRNLRWLMAWRTVPPCLSRRSKTVAARRPSDICSSMPRALLQRAWSAGARTARVSSIRTTIASAD